MPVPLPITTSVLLESLRDETDPNGWRAFSDRYWPVLVGLGQKLGLQEPDAADAAQWTLTEFLRLFRDGKYERGRGRLSAFVIGIARNRIRTLLRQMHRAPGALGDAHPETEPAIPDDASLTLIWEQERRRAVLHAALAELRRSARLSPASLLAFELVAIQALSPQDAARQAGITVDEVYLARHRCTRRLRELVAELTAAWEHDA
jgi:RNA polymerase sigma-70 factor, ECF subfamily